MSATPDTNENETQKNRDLRPRDAYLMFSPVQTRWMDNDIYGHVNNVVYYSYFDTVINRFLIAEGGLDIERGSVIGVVAESHCRYSSGLAFPMDIDAGLLVSKLGRSSVRYEIGLFSAGSAIAAAEGWFVHVFVDRATRRPVPIPDRLRGALARLFVVGERG
jgi:acyl-CoA thioester hydrolase